MMRIQTRARRRAIIWLGLCWAVSGLATTSKGDFFSVTNLVTNDQTVNSGQTTDTFLKNPWGISHSASSPFWVLRQRNGCDDALSGQSDDQRDVPR